MKFVGIALGVAAVANIIKITKGLDEQAVEMKMNQMMLAQIRYSLTNSTGCQISVGLACRDKLTYIEARMMKADGEDDEMIRILGQMIEACLGKKIDMSEFQEMGQHFFDKYQQARRNMYIYIYIYIYI